MRGGLLIFATLALACAAAAQTAPGQGGQGQGQAGPSRFSPVRTSPLGRAHNGWRVYGVSASFGYSTLALPLTGSAISFGLERLESDYDGTASASVGYSYGGPKSNVSLLYSPSMVRRVRFSGLNALNQSAGFRAAREIAPRWDLSASADASDATLDQLLFTPAVLSAATRPAATLDDLIGASRAGQYTSDQLASLLTGTPYVLTPSRSLVFGTNFFSINLSSYLSYRATPRLRFTVSGGASRSQTRNGSGNAGGGQLNFLIPRNSSQQTGFMADYSHSLRTQLTVSGTVSRVDSSLGQYAISNARITVSRKLTPRWFAGGGGGYAHINVLRNDPQFSMQTAGPGYVAEGNLGHTARDHVLTASYTRSAGDTFGFASQSSHLFAGSWQWAPPVSSWALFAGGGFQRLSGGALGDIQFWHGNAGVLRSLNNQLSLIFTYGYVDRRTRGPSSATFLQQDLNGSSVRVSLLWNPQGAGIAQSAPGGR